MEKITEIVERLAAPIALKHGCVLWDVEFVKEGGGHFLRVFIDCEGGVTIDQCEKVSRELDVLLDEADPIDKSYTLEVSSAGLERTLKRQSDFAAYIGSLVEVRLYRPEHGAKEHMGKLHSRDAEKLMLDTEGKLLEFCNKDIALVRLRIEF